MIYMTHSLKPSFTSIERQWLFLASCGVLILTSIPYLICAYESGSEMVFTGIIINPSDGFSYLAKMHSGWEGNWLFHLPFTVEEGKGAYLFLYYFLLGHIAFYFGLSLPVVFHLARIFSGFMLLWFVYRLVSYMTENINHRKLMWLVVVFSSGFGCVVEKYGLGFSYIQSQSIWYISTFYSLIVNPHLPLAIAFMIAMFVQVVRTLTVSWICILWFIFFSWLLALILPFAVIVVYVVLGFTLLTIWYNKRICPKSQIIITAIAGVLTLPILLYMQISTEADATLKEWSLQNNTPSPSLFGLIMAYGLLFIFLVPGFKVAWKRRSDWDILLMTWVVVVFILMYLPYSLQYRFSIGLHVPISILATYGLYETIRLQWLQRLMVGVFCISSMYLIVNLIGRSPVNIAIKHYELMFISKQEQDVFKWLEAHVPSNKLVICAPQSGLFIPAYAGNKVIYGHIMETVKASQKIKLIRDFFSNKLDQNQLLREYNVDYLLFGPRERKIGNIESSLPYLQKVYNSGDVTLYKVDLCDDCLFKSNK